MIYYGSNMRFFLMGIVVAMFAVGALLALGTFVLKGKLKKRRKD